MFKSHESEDWNREKLVCGLRQRLQYRTKHWKYGRQEPGFLTRLHHPGWKELESCMLCIQLDHMQRGWKLVVGRGSAHCFCCMGHGRANGNGDNRDASLGDERAANDERASERSGRQRAGGKLRQADGLTKCFSLTVWKIDQKDEIQDRTKIKALQDGLWICVQKIFWPALLDVRTKADYLLSCTKISDAGCLFSERHLLTLSRRLVSSNTSISAINK